MRKPEVLQKALARALSSGEDSDNKDSISRSDKSPSDEESPLMGGEVKICVGCISRERKRAARKKPKQIKEEEEWVMDEPKRAVVFNNHEVREWLPTSGMQSLNGGMDGNGVLGSWEDGMIMELHMRLACYCRHQGEKEGFRVIFTIKNHEDVVIAQQITSSILITDDHKSSAATPAINGGSQDIKLVGTGYQPPQNQLHQALFGAPVGSISSHDNQSVNAMGSGAHGSTSQPPSFSQNSFSPPPSFGRNMSPASPMSSTGLHQQSPPPQLPNGNPTAKKRRINSVPKVPAGLTMTRMDNPRPSFQQQSGPMIMNNQPSQLQAPALNPFSAAQSPQAFWTDEPMTPSGMSDHAGFQFDSTQNNNFNGLDNRSQFASPQSARPSRAPSPSPQEAFLRAQQAAPRIPMHLQSQVRHVQTHTFQAVPPDPEASQIPEICRLVPHDGTCRGGIEVTVLGRSFVPGLTVLFGETPASHNYFFSPTTMVCLLPPNAQPGPVVVSIRNVQLGTAADKVRFFTYVNDADKSLMELALQIVGMKMRGTMSNPQDIARSIIEGDTGSAFGQGSPRASQDGTSGSQQHQQYLRRLAGESGFGRQGLEGTLLKFLDAMDLDESPYPFPLHLKNKSGQTMLHLASMLNMGRFVAALLARGASVQETDANGYTPLHFAALHRHLDIYRRLLRHNANPNLLTRNGDNAIDLVFQEGSSRGRSHLVSRSRHQSRASSASSENHFGNRSRAGSSASLSSMWDPNGMEAGRQKYVGVDDFFGATDESSSGDGGDSVDERWMHSRRGSRHETTAVKASLGDNVLATDHGAPPVPGVMAPPAEGLAPAAAVTAWREQIAASIQNLQNLHWNLPTMPTAADYQHIFQNPMAALQNPMARFHALMPPSPFAQDRNVVNSQEVKKGQYTWWELFSAPQAPPAYEELFPHQPSSSHGPPGDIVLERGSAVDDAKVQEEELVPPGSSGSSSSASSLDVDELRYRISRGVQDMTKEQQDEYRAHARKMKKIESDRRLYFFWLPALILILIAMTMSYGPVVWCALKVIISFAKAVFNDPSSIKESMAAMASGVAVAGGFLEPRIVPLA
ncbi:hypothetical protein L873DRAFT_1673180 [Choiromyces venosus 120613-1]|uniref:IPT/TIG domain-containing protein n=1 Tax=Choiromyces venosus 120613-1 TaxID=1336337 RepID=A0A3N4JWC5_9PEZI|nr:hypothetical protein L873DRAFT_1673180 [Choiromyces venosus 120613-1]